MVIVWFVLILTLVLTRYYNELDIFVMEAKESVNVSTGQLVTRLISLYGRILFLPQRPFLVKRKNRTLSGEQLQSQYTRNDDMKC